MFFFKLYTNSRSFWAFGYIHSNYNFLHYPNVNKNKFLQLNVIIWTFWAVWICTKITYACAKKYLVCYKVLLLKVFCLKQPQKTETFLGNNNRMEWDDNRVRVSPQRETFDSHNLQNLHFFLWSDHILHSATNHTKEETLKWSWRIWLTFNCARQTQTVSKFVPETDKTSTLAVDPHRCTPRKFWSRFVICLAW